MPAQCPSCSRVLGREFIAELTVADATCPQCGETLTQAQFHGSEELVHAPEPLAESVRPPDLSDDVLAEATGSGGGRDPLAGWDEGVIDARTTSRRGGARATRTRNVDVLAAIGAASVGGVVGAVVWSERRVLGAVAGAGAAGGTALAVVRLADDRGGHGTS